MNPILLVIVGYFPYHQIIFTSGWFHATIPMIFHVLLKSLWYEAGAPGPPAQMTTPRPLTLIGGHDRKISCFPHVGQWKSQRSTWNCWLVSFPTWIWEEFLLKRGKIMDISPAAFQLGIKTVPNKNRLVENVLDIEFGLCKYLRMFACLWLEKNGRMRWLTRWEQDMVKTTCEPTRNTHEH